MRFRTVVALLASLVSTAAFAGPLPVTCVRDMKDDPKLIRVLFDAVDRMAVQTLSGSAVHFILDDRGSIGTEDFVRRMNFHDGRVDEGSLRVTGIYPLQSAEKIETDGSYLVRTTRSAWFDRGSQLHNSYTTLNDTWLVSFSGCEINRVREVPELHYFLADEPVDG